MTESVEPASPTVGDKRKLDSESDTQLKKQVTKPSIEEKSTAQPTTTTTENKFEIPQAIEQRFAPGLFASQFKDNLKQSIASSGPYKHGVIHELMNDSLLRKVRQEIIDNLVFTPKETDIYKVCQTGDLRNLSGLPKEELDKLPALYALSQALYSPEFRHFLEYVTGSGSLSGTKQDLSINVYKKGCQLLNHDDVIGSRRISYILYLPDPVPDQDALDAASGEPEQVAGDLKKNAGVMTMPLSGTKNIAVWEYPKNGGALRLYPIEKPNVPKQDWSLVVPPAWNQLAFFTVQPGLSFHDVEEVYVDKPRMSISGWFHIPQEGEPGFIKGELEETQAKSSLQQLESDELAEFDFPKKTFVSIGMDEIKKGDSLIENAEKIQEAQDKKVQDQVITIPSTESEEDAEEQSINVSPLLELSQAEIQYLAKYMNPTLLKTESIFQLSDYFIEKSLVEIKDFLAPQIAHKLKRAIDRIDIDDEANGVKVPFFSNEVKSPWKLAGPPHKVRYMYMDGTPSYQSEVQLQELQDEQQQQQQEDEKKSKFNLAQLFTGFSEEFKKAADSIENSREREAVKLLVEVSEFFKSKAFRNWLRLVSHINVIASRVLTRRFRPSLDYTLATGLHSSNKEKERAAKKSHIYHEQDPTSTTTAKTTEEQQNGDKKEESTENNTNKETEDKEKVLEIDPNQMIEATLNLTPSKGWEDGELGGYELYMAIDADEEEQGLDPAVYRRRNNKPVTVSEDKKKSGNNSKAVVGGGVDDGDEYEDQDDDGVLLNTPADWNLLTLTVRDAGILKFVKYVSGNAPGSRWDISAEWKVEKFQDEENDDDNDDDDENE